jgi:hypothetical protein
MAKALIGPRYSREDVEAVLLDTSQPPPPSGVSFAGLNLSPTAEPPLGKFMVLLDTDAKFKKSVERKRTDLKDNSPSAYDFSLANIAMRAGWSPQEIASLVIYARYKNGEDLEKVLRPDYLPGMLEKIQAGLQYDQAIDELEQWHVGRVKDGVPDEDEEKRDRLKSLIRTVLEIDVEEVVQYGRQTPQFFLITPTEPIPVGTVGGIISEERFRNAVAIGYHKYIPNFTRVQWRSIAQALLDLVTEVDTGPEALPGAEMAYWLETYLTDEAVCKQTAEGVKTGQPIRDDNGDLWVYVGTFADFLKRRHAERVSHGQLCNLLTQYGAVRGKLEIHQDGKHTSRSYWRLPVRSETAL